MWWMKGGCKSRKKCRECSGDRTGFGSAQVRGLNSWSEGEVRVRGGCVVCRFWRTSQGIWAGAGERLMAGW